MEPLVSVITPCFNAGEWIRETLNSVVAQNYDNLEIIAIDDGSTDETAHIIREEFPSVRLVATTNQGASRARNLGTSLASGRFLQYLDADDLITQRKLRIQVSVLEESGADVAYGDWQKIEPGKDGFALGEIVRREMEDEPELDLFGDFWCPPAAYLFRRSIVEKVGRWNEGLPVIEDVRFALDCALRGGRFVYCPGVSAYYRVHATGSLSRGDLVAFTRCVYRNACEIEAWWLANSGISATRRRALVKSIGQVARSSYERDPQTFDTALKHLERLSPGYVPAGPLRLKVMSKMIGYRDAEKAAAWYRSVKRSLVRSLQSSWPHQARALVGKRD